MEVKLPMISVLMSVYKEPLEWVDEAIESILNQSFTDFEFIIINDNPTRQELFEYLDCKVQSDTRIKISVNEHNIGLTKSLNRGLDMCQGKYIARMDADDISMPTRFEKQVSFLEDNPEYGIVGCWLKDIGNKDAVRKIPVEDKEIKLRWIIRPPFDHPATMMRASVIHENSIRYDENLRYAQDMQLWYDMGKICLFANIPEVLFLHRHNRQQVSILHKESQLDTTKMVRRKLLNDLGYEIGMTEGIPETITLSYIDRVKQILATPANGNREAISYYFYYLFLSLDRYSLRSLLNYLNTICVYRTGLTHRDHLRILAKHIAPQRYSASGVN